MLVRMHARTYALWTSLACHSLGLVGYVMLWDYSFWLYHQWGGVVVARGVDTGSAGLMVFYAVIAINVLVAISRQKRLKYTMVCVLGILILAYLLPDYPLRGPLFCALAIGTTGLAVAVSAWVRKATG